MNEHNRLQTWAMELGTWSELLCICSTCTRTNRTRTFTISSAATSHFSIWNEIDGNVDKRNENGLNAQSGVVLDARKSDEESVCCVIRWRIHFDKIVLEMPPVLVQRALQWLMAHYSVSVCGPSECRSMRRMHFYDLHVALELYCNRIW